MAIDVSPAPSRTIEEITALVDAQIARFSDSALRAAIEGFLVPARMEMRTWDWSDEALVIPTWVVAESSRYDYGIVYSDRGFGPAFPWGLVFSSQPNFGADYSWFESLEAAFLDSRLLEEFQERDASA